MKTVETKRVVQSSILFVLVLLPLVLLTLTVSSVSACVPSEDSDSICTTWRIKPPTPTSAPVAAVLSVANVPRGDSPASALDITDTWQSIAPGANVWYKTPYSDGYRIIELQVDSPTQNALGLSIFSPEQTDGLWLNTKPVGRGMFNKGQPQHALTWIAGYAKPGVWYALLQNFSDSPVPYRLTGNISPAAVKHCHGYWEGIHGQYVYWVDCGHYTTVP